MKTLIYASIVVFGLMLLGCSEDSITPTEDPIDYKNDFFPLKEGKQWEYLNTYLDQDSTLINSITLTEKIDGDTIIEGLKYKQFVDENGFLVKIARKEGSKYYGRNHEFYGGFSHEYVFLDTAIVPGDSWSYLKNDGNNKTEYIVKELHDVYTVNGVEFNSVLELETNYYLLNTTSGDFELTLSTKHFYARGLGEIYSYYPGNDDREGYTHHNVVISGYFSN